MSNDYFHHIRLIVPEKLSKDNTKLFYSTVKDTGPDSITKSIEVYDKLDVTKTVNMKVKKKGKSYCYIVPLARDLTEKEAEKIVIVWSQLYEEGDFVIETSTPYTGEENDDNECEQCDTNVYENEEVRKFHATWMNRLLESGWRYGTAYSNKEKVHPMLLPWEQIPTRIKEKAYKNIVRKLSEI